jgi:enoyl-CoA hydratase
MIIASDRATFGSPLVKLGLIPDMGCSGMLPRRVGEINAFELMSTGKIIDAAEALRIGLVNRVVPHDQLAAVVTDVACGMAKNSAAAISAIKQAVSEASALEIEQAMGNEVTVVQGLMALEEFRAGLQASRDKRSSASKG